MGNSEKSNLRYRIYEMVEPYATRKAGRFYDVLIIVCIAVSILPLFFKQSYGFFEYLVLVPTVVFIIDYALRWATADYHLKRGKLSFLLYPVTPWAIIDLLAIIPAFGILNPAFMLLRILRVFLIFRVFKGLRYSRHFRIIGRVFRKNKDILIALALVIGAYIAVSALVVFNVEPQTFDNYFDALYWAVMILTTAGSDIYPVSDAGRVVGMLSSLVGILMIALPTGVLTAGFMSELSARRAKRAEKEKDAGEE